MNFFAVVAITLMTAVAQADDCAGGQYLCF